MHRLEFEQATEFGKEVEDKSLRIQPNHQKKTPSRAQPYCGIFLRAASKAAHEAAVERPRDPCALSIMSCARTR